MTASPSPIRRLLASGPVRYVVVGTIGYLVNLVVFWAGTRPLGASPYAVLVVAYVANTAWNFAANRIWTFGGGSSSPSRDMARFLVVALVLLALNYATFHAFYEWVGMPDVLAQTVSILCGLPVGFLLNRHWAFAPDAPAQQSPSTRS